MSTENVSAEQLRLFIERIENIETTLEDHKQDRKDVYAELKGEGFDTKTVRQIIKIRKQDRADRLEAEAILETYLNALGID